MGGYIPPDWNSGRYNWTAVYRAGANQVGGGYSVDLVLNRFIGNETASVREDGSIWYWNTWRREGSIGGGILPDFLGGSGVIQASPSGAGGDYAYTVGLAHPDPYYVMVVAACQFYMEKYTFQVKQAPLSGEWYVYVVDSDFFAATPKPISWIYPPHMNTGYFDPSYFCAYSYLATPTIPTDSDWEEVFGAPPTYTLYHRIVSGATVTPADGTKMVAGMYVPIVATADYGKIMSTYTVDGIAKYLDGDTDYSGVYGPVTQDVYVDAVAEADGIADFEQPAGRTFEYDCDTNECCSPVFSIETNGTPSTDIAIDSSTGIITGSIPKDATPGDYYIDVQVTGPYDTASGRINMEVTEYVPPGINWSAKSYLPGDIVALAEAPDGTVYATTANGHIYKSSDKFDNYEECTYSGGTPGVFGGISVLKSGLIVAVGAASGIALDYLWYSSDGSLFTQSTYGPSPDEGGVYRLSDSLALMTKVNSGYVRVIDTATWTQLRYSTTITGGLNEWTRNINSLATDGSVWLIATGQTSGSGAMIHYSADAFVTDPMPLVLNKAMSGNCEARVYYTLGKFYAALMAPYASVTGTLYSSANGTDWTELGSNLPSANTGGSFLPLNDNVSLVANPSGIWRTTDQWATAGTRVLSGRICTALLELSDGTLLCGMTVSGVNPTIYYSED